MAAGIINLQKASGGITKISSVDGTGVTELVLPESGELIGSVGNQTIGGVKTFTSNIIPSAGFLGGSLDGYIQYFTSSISGPKISGKYTQEERYLSLTADDINLWGTVKVNGSNVSLAGHSHTYADLTGTVPTWNQDTNGNAATATNALYASQWTNPITLTIGASSQFLDGTGSLSYSLASIGAASSTHAHGNISTGGLISTETSMGNGDAILLADASDSSRVIKSNITLDTTNTTQYLRRDGAWVTPPTASHTHGDISNTGTITSTAVTPASGDYILISDTSASGIIKRAIALGTSTTTFLRNDGTWQTGTGAVQSVNGYTGAVNTVNNTITTATVNSLVYGVLQGTAVVQTSSGTRLKIDTGFYNPQGGSTGNSITFNVSFTQRPAVFAFPVRAASTTATLVTAKATAVSTTGATFISSYISSTATYTPSNTNETYCWVAIGY